MSFTPDVGDEDTGGFDDLGGGIENFHDRIDDEIEGSLPFAAEIVKRHLWELTPKRTGLTAESWEVDAVDRFTFDIYNTNEPVATFLEEGTSDHWIYPVTATALHWIDDLTGEEGFSKGHMVSGITPMNIQERALDESEDELEELWDGAIDAAGTGSFQDYL